jgi:hypothetical protein
MSDAECREVNRRKQAMAGYGFWCFDCDAAMLAETYALACANAFDAGWQQIRGVDRCPACASREGSSMRQTHERE